MDTFLPLSKKEDVLFVLKFQMRRTKGVLFPLACRLVSGVGTRDLAACGSVRLLA